MLCGRELFYDTKQRSSYVFLLIISCTVYFNNLPDGQGLQVTLQLSLMSLFIQRV